jgi:uncharacterized protein (TIGR02996 family)
MNAAVVNSLLQGCKDAPADDASRLVMADWLEDHGEADRAEFVRLSVALEAGDLDLADEAPALARLHELYTRNAATWVGTLAQRAGEFCFRRGLIEVRTTAAELPGLLAATPAHALPWIETLALECKQPEEIEQYLALDELAHFSALDVGEVMLLPESLARLGNCPRLAQLRRLRAEVHYQAQQKAVGQALAGWSLPDLRVLQLSRLKKPALTALLKSPWTRSLEVMDYGEETCVAAALAEFPTAPRPSYLNLDLTKLKDGAREVFAAPAVGQVARLKVDGNLNQLGTLLGARDWPRLRRLSLTQHVTATCAADLAGADGLTALRRLDLDSYRASDLAGLAAAHWFAGIRHLDGVRFASVGDLLEQKLPQLRTLELGHIEAPDYARLADALPALTALSLTSAHTSTVNELAASPLAPRLRHLCLGNIYGEKANAALLAPAFAALTSLDVGSLVHDPLDLEALSRGPWRGLLRLRVFPWPQAAPPDAVAALLAPEALPRLTALTVSESDDRLANAVAAALHAGPRLPGLAQLDLVDRGNRPILGRLGTPTAFPRQR